MFDIDLSEIPTLFASQNYIINKEQAIAVYTAIKLQKPLLIDGVPGVGKTEIAKVLSRLYSAELIRLQCYEGITPSKVLYDFNGPKQMLYQSILQETITKKIDNKNFENFQDTVRYLDESISFYSNEFLIKKPVYRAIDPTNPKKKILLIDELDKADLEIEAYLLETLSDYSISIPELGTISAERDNLPLTIITSNNNRDISEAFKRRCVYLNVKYPSVAQESKILELKTHTSKEFSDMLAHLLSEIRSKLDLKQFPSIAEAIDWANILYNIFHITEVSNRYKTELIQTLNVITKNDYDMQKIRVLINNIL